MENNKSNETEKIITIAVNSNNSNNNNNNDNRLSSLRKPRDLTLSLSSSLPSSSSSQSSSSLLLGLQRKTQNKKTFSPNLKVIRNKNKINASPDVGGGGAKDRRRDRNRDNQKHKDRKHKSDSHNVLKSQGVFSEGMAALTKYSTRQSYSGLQKSTHGDSGFMQKPGVGVVDKRHDKQISEDSSGIDIKDILKEEGDEDNLMTAFCPVKLPLASKCSEENEIDTKSGKMSDRSADLFRTKNTPTLLLMQFPDNLPGRGPDDPSKRPEDADPVANNVCELRDLEEGRVGKIVVYKSGKVKLVIGDTDYDLDIGTQPRFQQEVLSVSADVDERNGSAVNIGRVRNKLIIVPQWETLFEKLDTLSQ